MKTKTMEEGMQLIDTALLVHADWNYKEEDEDLQKKLIANLKRNKQIENIIVRELPDGKFEVINGNHRLSACRSLGIPKMWAFNMGPLTLRQAQRVAIETNETRFQSDHIRLSRIMKDLTVDFSTIDLTETMPYSSPELHDFARLAEFDYSQYLNTGAAPAGSVPQPVVSVNVSFKVKPETHKLFEELDPILEDQAGKADDKADAKFALLLNAFKTLNKIPDSEPTCSPVDGTP